MKIKKDLEFEQLIQPLSAIQWQNMEAQILTHACSEPIYIWHGNILDGQERYEICCKHEIPVEVKELPLKSREEAIAWICIKQWKRLDLTREMQKYLIGKRYAMEKVLMARNMVGHNQYSKISCEMLRDSRYPQPQYRTADPLGNEYGICNATIQKYGAFASAVDKITRIDSSMRTHLLSGQARISHENVIVIANMGGSQIKKIAYLFEENPDFHLQIADIERIVGHCIPQDKTAMAKFAEPSVKDMPLYDPDIEVSGLSLTIPSWRSSIDRIQNTVDMKSITEAAHKKLEVELLSLRSKIDSMLSTIWEGRINE